MVTGASSGIGREAARALAGMGAELFLLCRDRSRGEATAKDITDDTGNSNISLLLGDLTSGADIRRIASTFLELNKPLHVLLNNAGLFNTTRVLTPGGQEEMFAVNHLAYFLLTSLLLDRLKASAPARIVNVASGAHVLVKGINFEDLTFEDGFSALKVYSHSKLANILFTRELARRLEGSGVTANAVHPGAIGTGLGAQNGWLGTLINTMMRLFLRSPARGAQTSIYACISPELDGMSGQYLENCKAKRPKPWAEDDAAAERLWEVSEGLIRAQASAS